MKKAFDVLNTEDLEKPDQSAASSFIQKLTDKKNNLQDFYSANQIILSRFITMQDLENGLTTIIAQGISNINAIEHGKRYAVTCGNYKKIFKVIRYEQEFILTLDTSSNAIYQPMQKNPTSGAFKVVNFEFDITGKNVKLITKFTINPHKPSLEENKSIILDALKEIEISQRLTHPNLIKYYLAAYEKSTIDKTFFAIVTSYSEYFNYNLKEYMLRVSSMEEFDKHIPHLIQALNDLLAALEYLHDNFYVHQDVKPENILFSKLSRFVLADYGLTTQHGIPCLPTSTQGYESPEIYFTHKKLHYANQESNYLDFAQFASIARMHNRLYPTKMQELLKPDYCSDLWSVGVIIHEMLTDSVDYVENKTLAINEKSNFLQQLLNPDYRARIGIKKAKELFAHSGQQELTTLLQQKAKNRLFCRQLKFTA